MPKKKKELQEIIELEFRQNEQKNQFDFYSSETQTPPEKQLLKSSRDERLKEFAPKITVSSRKIPVLPKLPPFILFKTHKYNLAVTFSEQFFEWERLDNSNYKVDVEAEMLQCDTSSITKELESKKAVQDAPSQSQISPAATASSSSCGKSYFQQPAQNICIKSNSNSTSPASVSSTPTKKITPKKKSKSKNTESQNSDDGGEACSIEQYERELTFASPSSKFQKTNFLVAKTWCEAETHSLNAELEWKIKKYNPKALYRFKLIILKPFMHNQNVCYRPVLSFFSNIFFVVSKPNVFTSQINNGTYLRVQDLVDTALKMKNEAEESEKLQKEKKFQTRKRKLEKIEEDDEEDDDEVVIVDEEPPQKRPKIEQQQPDSTANPPLGFLFGDQNIFKFDNPPTILGAFQPQQQSTATTTTTTTTTSVVENEENEDENRKPSSELLSSFPNSSPPLNEEKQPFYSSYEDNNANNFYSFSTSSFLSQSQNEKETDLFFNQSPEERNLFG